MTEQQSDPRAQRLVDEFHEGASWDGGSSVRRGLAWVLRHIADTEGDLESWGAIPAHTLEELADRLMAYRALAAAPADGPGPIPQQEES